MNNYPRMIIELVIKTFIRIIVIYFLWNWLVPNIFGFTKITFSESTGLTILFSCLFNSNGIIDEFFKGLK